MTERERVFEIVDNYKFDYTRCYLCDIPDNDCEKCGNEALIDYLLANGVIVPPCKVGDKVYVIRTRNKKGKYVDTIVEKTVQRIEIGRNNCMWLKFGAVDGDSVNNTYMTYGEAEQALKECEENA